MPAGGRCAASSAASATARRSGMPGCAASGRRACTVPAGRRVRPASTAASGQNGGSMSSIHAGTGPAQRGQTWPQPSM